MRKDLVFKFLNNIESDIYRLNNQLDSDSYVKLVTRQTKFLEMSDIELQFIKEHLINSIEQLEEYLNELLQEFENRNLSS
jgi:hypothetical protein